MILLTAGQSMDRLFDLDMQLIADATLMIIAVLVLFFAMSFSYSTLQKGFAEQTGKDKE